MPRRNSHRLVPMSPEHISTVIGWADSAEVMRQWIGRDDQQWLPGELRGRCNVVDGISAYVLLNGAIPSAYGETWWDEADQSFELARLIVAPVLRGRGIGAMLIEELVAIAPEAATDVLVRVFESNTPALLCYEKAGFLRVSESEERLFNQSEAHPFIWMRRSVRGVSAGDR